MNVEKQMRVFNRDSLKALTDVLSKEDVGPGRCMHMCTLTYTRMQSGTFLRATVVTVTMLGPLQVCAGHYLNAQEISCSGPVFPGARVRELRTLGLLLRDI